MKKREKKQKIKIKKRAEEGKRKRGKEKNNKKRKTKTKIKTNRRGGRKEAHLFDTATFQCTTKFDALGESGNRNTDERHDIAALGNNALQRVTGILCERHRLVAE